MYKNFHLRIYRFSQFPDNINNENLSVAILSLTSWSAWSNDKGLSWLPADPLKWKFAEFHKSGRRSALFGMQGIHRNPFPFRMKTTVCPRELHSLTVSKSVRFLYSEFRRCSWDVKLSIGWSENIQLPAGENLGKLYPPGFLSKYFRPHLVN